MEEGEVSGAGRKRSVGRLEEWSYGFGEEGVIGESEEGLVLCFGLKFPWWGLVAWRLGFKRVNLVVTQVNSPYLKLAREYFGEWKVNDAPTGLSNLSELNSATVLLFDTSPPVWLEDIIWKLPSVRLIVRGVGTKTKVPRSWAVREVVVSHQSQGGTSNGNYRAFVYERVMSKAREVIPLGVRPAQDLRSVMKMAQSGGRPDSAPGGPIPRETGKSVVRLRPGVVANWGLYDVKSSVPPRVKTLFGGDYWVTRGLTPMERATVYDVPEKLSRKLAEKELSSFVRMAPGPVKCLQGLVDTLREVGSVTISKALEGEAKRLREEIDADVVGGKRLKTESVEEVVGPIRRHAMPLVETVEEEEADEIAEEVKSGDPDRDLKAAKDDNAAVPVEMWDKYVREGCSGVDPLTDDQTFRDAANVIRVRLLCWWKRGVTRSLLKWVRDRRRKGESPTNEAMSAGRDAVTRAANSTMWGWPAGSTPFFWRWPGEYEEIIMSGLKLWMMDKLEPWTEAQRPPRDALNKEKVMAKLADIRKKGYVEVGQVESLISFFDVAKGKEDIRMVYDGTKSGLNDALWAPWFPLPTVETMLRSVTGGTWLGDNDVGEMFLNFMLHEEVRRLCGVDFTLYFPEEVSEDHQVLWARWTRCAMGLRTSPYQAVQGMLWAQEVIMGDRLSETNVFRWKAVKLNLPGSEDYNASEPWVCKVRMDGILASDINIYVDDIRTTASSEAECWKASQRVSSVLGYLGLQDAARKRRRPGQGGAAWAGSVVHTVYGQVTRTVSQEKWDKTRKIVAWMQEVIDSGETDIDYKVLESHRGFLVYVARTYPGMRPFLKGIHATLDSWRDGRDGDGWKTDNRRNRVENDEVNEGRFEPKIGGAAAFGGQEKPPRKVRMVNRFRSDVHALEDLTSFDVPPHQLVRASKTGRAVFGFGDASGTGFGASVKIGDVTVWQSGQWSWTFKQESSNYRELGNLVQCLEGLAEKGVLDGCEIFMFTDNSTAESAHYRGTSSSRSLFELVLRLKKLEMSRECLIHLVHIAGTRMIFQGTDGLSRGDQNAGVMRGENMLDHVPLNLSCLKRSSAVKPWIKKWLISQTQGVDPVFLGPDDWPQSHPSRGVYVWTPPPAAAAAAVEWMAQSIHKRPSSMHVFVAPRLMTAWWRRVLSKATDVSFVVPVGTPVWGKEQHEPLILAIYLPLRKNAPYRIRGTEEAERLERELRCVWKDDFAGARVILRKFLGRSIALGALPQHLL